MHAKTDASQANTIKHIAALAKTIPVKINTVLAMLFLVLQGLFYFILPLLLHKTALWALCLIPITLLTTSYWSLIHETIHGTFHPHKGINQLAGRILCLFFPAPFGVLRLGHLMHHRFNRSNLDRSEVYAGQMVKRFSTTMRFYVRLLVGLYLLEVLSSILVLLPNRLVRSLIERNTKGEKKVLNYCEKHLLNNKAYWRNRIDAMAIIAMLSGSICLYGANWPVLLVALLLRGLFISFFDNAYHYDTRLDDRMAAYNLALSPLFAKTILYFNLHRTHHRFPSLPWNTLPRAMTLSQDETDGPYLGMSLRQLAGPRPAAEQNTVCPQALK